MHFSPAITSRFTEALDYARQQHGVQVRKGTQIPYITHLLAVAALVGEQGGTEEEMIAAILHDVVEDCGGKPRLEEIRARFGHFVCEIVEGCSDSFSDDPAEKLPWRERKDRYIHHLEQASDSVRLVSLCDKLHNLTSLLHDLEREGPVTWSRFNAQGPDQLWFFLEVDEILSKFAQWPATKTFSKAVQSLHVYMDESGNHSRTDIVEAC